MHLIYSALCPLSEQHDKPAQEDETELQLCYRAYLDTCNKYSSDIAEIQKYLPGWMPAFRRSF